MEIGELRSLMTYGRMLVQQYEAGKFLSLFCYRLELLSGRNLVFCLHPPFPAFEYSLRLGFIRSEMDSAKALIDASAVKGGPTASLMTAAEQFVDKFGNDLGELKHAGTPRRVLRLNFPIIPRLYESLKDAVFRDDLVSRERLLQDSLIHWLSTDQQNFQITEHLDVETFYAAWRYLKFTSLVDIVLLGAYSKRDLTLLLNSLVRSLDEQSAFELLRAFGISEDQAKDFFSLISADANHLGYLDLQYRPFLRIAETPVPWTGNSTKPQFLFAPALVSNSNVQRNVQSANRFRVESNARLFVDLVAAALRSRFEKVLTNKRVEGEKATDIDVMLLDGNTLYLFECKHSLPPAGPHELRDIWEEIEYATQQLEIATTILANVVRQHDYLAGWFPGSKARDTSNLKIASCVLCSHRIFSGVAHRGFPIRDFASLVQLCEGGIVGMAQVEANGEAVVHRYKVTRQIGFSGEDLNDYLSPDASYFKTFAPFMQAISRFHRFQDIVLARETYVHAVSLDDWDDQMSALGFAKETDTTVTLPFAYPGEDAILGRY